MSEQLKFHFESNDNNAENLEGWENVTSFEKVYKQPVFVGYDVMGNFRVNFKVINRHNVELIKSFIFPSDYSENKKIRTEVISATGPIGVNIHNDFLTYTKLSRKCFEYLLKKAIGIYNERVRIREKEDNDQLKLDF